MPSFKRVTKSDFESTPEETTSTVKHSLIGSVIKNTEDSAALIEAFMAVLESYNHPGYSALQALVESAQDEDDFDDIFDTVYQAMESLAMDGYYFGANGMGIWNYGYWEKTW